MAGPTAHDVVSSAPASLTLLVVGSFGPVGGQIFLILLGAVAGAFWALGKREKEAEPAAYLFMLRLVVASVVLTTATSYALEHIAGLPYLDCLLVCSFLLAGFSDMWPRIINNFVDRALSRVPSDDKH